MAKDSMTRVDILSIDELKRVFKSFNNLTGLNVTLYDEMGNVVLAQYSNRECDICCHAKANAQFGNVCRSNVTYGGKKALELGEPYIYRCGCGLIMCSAPVVLGGDYIGSISTGPVMLWENDEEAAAEFIENIKPLNLSNADIMNYLNSVKQLSCVNMTGAADILSVMVNYMCRQEDNFLKQRNQIYKQQVEISNMLIEKKLNSANLKLYEQRAMINRYPIEMEKELIAYVQMGDEKNAKRILNMLLGEIFSYASGNLDTMKSRIHELISMLSRAAVDAGAPLESLAESMNGYTKILFSDCGFEQLCYMTSTAMEEFIRIVYLYRSSKKTSEHLSNAIAYIGKNYGQVCTLESVASAVYVSGYYLSHLFRDEMNTTFSDYLIKIRMENAKKMLKDSTHAVAQIAMDVGYSDIGYFNKVFKKYTGISAKAFRQLNT